MRRFVTLAAICAAVVFAAPAIHGQARNAKAPALSGGNGLLYIGTYKARSRSTTRPPRRWWARSS